MTFGKGLLCEETGGFCMIRIAVCDDEKYFADQIRDLLVKFGDEIGETICVKEFYSGMALLEAYDCKFDMVFLDIKMPELDGVKAAEGIRKRDQDVTIIFLTSLLGRAIDGYKVAAANFLIKPVDKKKLTREIDRWINRRTESKQECLLVENRTGQYKIPVTSLRYIETYNRNLLLHTDDKIVVCCNRKLRDLKGQLEKYGFAQSHKGIIVNLSYVDTTGANDITLVTREVVPVSRSMKKEFMSRLAGYLGGQI